jgi:MFS family permease
LDGASVLVFDDPMPLLHDLPRNSRNCLVIEPMWALFGGVIFYFAPLYMKELGVTEVEMGLINSVGLFFAFVFFLVAGPLTNKYGRHRTSLVWDIFSWTTSMVLWALAQDFWWFLVAVFFNSAVKVTMVSWNLLVSEDARDDQRVKIFAIVNLIGALGGFVSLVAGLLLDTFGVVPTMRVTYFAGALCMTTMFVVRNFFTTETENGRRVREATQDTPLVTLVVDQLASLGRAVKDGHFVVLTVLYLLITAVSSFAFFQILYLKDTLGYTNTELAVVPAVNSLLTIVLLTVVLPRIPRNAERLGLLVGFGVCLVGAVGFLFLGPHSLGAVLAVQGLGAAALVLVGTYRDSVFMNTVEEAQKAELFGLVNMLAMLLSIPTGWLAGWLFSLHPLGPFVALVGLFALGAGATLRLMGHHREQTPR